jgi:hypothetical protein
LFYRVGNLFFEYNGYGYELVYYPEKFYSYNSSHSQYDRSWR